MGLVGSPVMINLQKKNDHVEYVCLKVCDFLNKSHAQYVHLKMCNQLKKSHNNNYNLERNV